jgi:TIR domain
VSQLPPEVDRNFVFISYRHSDTWGIAQRIFSHLEECLGVGRVFLDLEGLRPGAEWEKEIRQHLDRSGAVVVLIGPTWLAALKERAAIAARGRFVGVALDLRAWAIVLGVGILNFAFGLNPYWAAALALAALVSWLAVAYFLPSRLSHAIGSEAHDPDDQVRREIVRALEKHIPIHPVLVNGETMLPRREQLSEDLRPLLAYQALPIPDTYFKHGMAMLCEDLKRTLAQGGELAP